MIIAPEFLLLTEIEYPQLYNYMKNGGIKKDKLSIFKRFVIESGFEDTFHSLPVSENVDALYEHIKKNEILHDLWML